jgi:hypothetical protein
MTPWAMEKQCSVIYTHEVFSKFQEQLIVARDHCIIQGFSESEDTKIVTISSQSGKERVVEMNKSNMFGRCSCYYESYGILCCHIIQVLRTEKQNEMPLVYIMKRWEKKCKMYVLLEFIYACFIMKRWREHYVCFVIGNCYLMTQVTY